jgi:signal transduction histidine kinase
VTLLDADGVILFANAAFLRAWECDHEEDVRGQSLAAITDRPEQTASLLRQLWETGHAFGLVRSRLKSGRDLSTPLDATAIRDEMGRPVRILALFGPGAENRLQEKWLTLERDRDELLAKMEKMSAELKAAHDAAEVASHTKNDFLAGMSHELRTPLNAIIGFSEVLLEPHFGALAPKQAEYLNHILESGLHLQGLIDDILTISKVETGSLVLQPRPVALRPLLDECLAPFGSKCENQGLSLRLIVQESACDLTFQADAGRLKQVLANLLDNAVKFTPEGGQILVTARLLETAESAQENPAYPSPYSLPRITQRQPAVTFPCVEIVVSDSGIGIDKDHLETVFSEFFQVRNSPHRKPAGTGLGLALTRRFVNMHGGQVWAESAGSGKGSRLVCILPLNAQPES